MRQKDIVILKKGSARYVDATKLQNNLVKSVNVTDDTQSPQIL